jgi:hypothetical protein
LTSEFHSSALNVPAKSISRFDRSCKGEGEGEVTNDEGVFGEIFEETSGLCAFEVKVEGVGGGKEREEGGEEEEEMHFREVNARVGVDGKVTREN